MNLRISQNIPDTLDINDHHVSLRQLPREMAECLSDQALVSILAYIIGPPSIVVVFLVLAFDEVLTVVVLEGGPFVQNLVDERVHELNQITTLDDRDESLVELINNVRADKHSLDVVLHILEVVGLGVDVFGDLHYIILLQVQVPHHEGIAHSSL